MIVLVLAIIMKEREKKDGRWHTVWTSGNWVLIHGKSIANVPQAGYGNFSFT
jgi:hypothetical protein